MALDTLRLAERWEAAGVPTQQAWAMVSALSEEVKDELATKELVRAEVASLRHQMLAAHVASILALALLFIFRT
jgi:hypothetical protein